MDNIAIIFPEVKVNIDIKDLSFDILENMLFGNAQRISQLGGENPSR